MAAGAPEGTTAGQRPATWEEYEALDHSRWTEYIDGYVVVNPPPGIRHQLASSRLWALLDGTLSDEFTVIESAGWKPGRNEYAPDVMVVRTADIDSDVRSPAPRCCASRSCRRTAHTTR